MLLRAVLLGSAATRINFSSATSASGRRVSLAKINIEMSKVAAIFYFHSRLQIFPKEFHDCSAFRASFTSVGNEKTYRRIRSPCKNYRTSTEHWPWRAAAAITRCICGSNFLLCWETLRHRLSLSASRRWSVTRCPSRTERWTS